jgi:microcystin-dependent protein
VTKVDLQYDLVNYTPASASPPQANFSRIEQHVNQELIERDGTVAMRAQLQLVGDPVNALDAAPKQYVDQVLPVGIIMMYGGTVAPPGGRWALCNGAELQTTDYPALYAVLGIAYGGSAGRFNLPNLTDKFPRGAAPGATGGNADAVVAPHTHPIDHTHAAAATGVESANHSHAGVDHLHGISINTGGAGNQHYHPMNAMEFIRYNPFAPSATLAGTTPGNGVPIDVFQISGMTTSYESHDHGHAVNGATQGADRALSTTGVSANHTHNFQPPALSGSSGAASGAAASVTNANLPPYLGVTYIIRVN